MTRLFVILTFLLGGIAMQAETGHEAWLRYAPLDDATAARYANLPTSIVAPGDSPILQNAQKEFISGVHGMLGRTLRLERTLPKEPAIVVGTVDEIRQLGGKVPALEGDGFWLGSVPIHGWNCIVITSPSERGVLYGTFAFLRKIATGASVQTLRDIQQPQAAIRCVDQWANLNGTIERGYGGRSIFFENDSVRDDLTRVNEYARLLASLGINGVAINNVNTNLKVLTPDFLPQLVRVAEVFRPL